MVNPVDDQKSAKVIPLNGQKKNQKCSMCGKPMVREFRPFCSRRCANLDLGNWLGEAYRVPTDEAPDIDEFFPDEE